MIVLRMTWKYKTIIFVFSNKLEPHNSTKPCGFSHFLHDHTFFKVTSDQTIIPAHSLPAFKLNETLFHSSASLCYLQVCNRIFDSQKCVTWASVTIESLCSVANDYTKGVNRIREVWLITASDAFSYFINEVLCLIVFKWRLILTI